MAVKEVVKAFALLIGYKIPDSSKETGTILDHMTDNMEDYNYAIDGVNGGLDETKDKLKEIEGSLAGFDKLNIIQSPKDDSTGGSGGSGGGGLSGMTLDPAILNALEQYKYIFDDVSMKAHQIRDTLLEWKDIVVKTINDKIFAPLGLSWDRYGGSITNNLTNALNDVKAIASDVIEILTDDWTSKFKAFADFGFSSLNVLTTALESMTSVLKGVWDRGGKALFEGCEKLRVAVLRLATSINDNFLAPLIRGLRNTVGVLVENVFGVFANNIASVINLMARMIEVVATSKGAVIALGSALTGMFLAIQLSKLADFISTLKQGNHIFDIFIPNILTNTKIFQKLESVLSNVSLSYEKYNNMLKNTGVYQKVTTAVENFSNKHLQAGGVLTNVFGKAVSWLCANPLVALASGLAVGVGALALFGQKSEETSYKVEELSEEMQAQIKKAQELKQTIEETANKTPEVANDYLAQIDVVGEYITMLRGLSNENGYVENVSKAKTLVNEINKLMPNTVKLTESNRIEWQKTPQEIEETTKALKEQAKQQAYMELYTEQLKNRMQAERQLAEYRTQVTEKQIEREEILAKIRSGNYSGDELAKLTSEGRALSKEIDALNDTISETEGAVKTATDSMEVYSNCIDGTSDVLGDTTEQVNKLCNALSLNDSQKANILNGVNDVMTAYEEMGKSTEENAKANKENLDKMIAKFQELGVQYGISTNDMLTIMKTKGVQLTEEQKKQFVNVTEKQKAELLKQQKAFDSNKSSLLDILVNYNLNESTLTARQSEEILNMLEQQGVNVSTLKEGQLKGYLKLLDTYNLEYNSIESKQYATLLSMLDKHGIDMESEQAQQYATDLRNAQSNGAESGQAYLNSIVNGFNKEQASTGGLSKAFSNVLSKVQDIARNSTVGIKTNISVPSGTNSKISNSIGTVNIKGKLTIGNVVSNLTQSVKDSLGKLGINLYAEGGFPRTGQLFIANERGPELVGKMGSRSVVANNQQIVEGVANGVRQGVYEGMARAMRNSGTFKPNITLVNNQVVDGKIVRKEVKKMQDENILLTGNPLFD